MHAKAGSLLIHYNLLKNIQLQRFLKKKEDSPGNKTGNKKRHPRVPCYNCYACSKKSSSCAGLSNGPYFCIENAPFLFHAHAYSVNDAAGVVFQNGS